ncbi:OadG family protein [Desulforhopalus vacuolatus]|uniref:OadG family protein n=1 Tax=Desulforhopalus vacuolatus TaxID=40414 RepID=UPI001966714D|nr:OadG family protein [Desulforhopalus vacuolatus]MBM9518635.1 OadG family protein [Desulforhopalus vacuolatus]
MDLKTLMEIFSDPSRIEALSAGDKLNASLITTVVGMGITFTALIILLFAISLMNRVLAKKPEAEPSVSTQITGSVSADEEMDEVVAAITAAIDLYIRPSHNNKVIIRNIRRVQDFNPRWSQAGLIDQLERRL